MGKSKQEVFIMSIIANLSLPLLSTGAVLNYYFNSAKIDVESPKDQELKSSASNKSINADKLDMYLLGIKGVKKLLKFSKKAILQVKFIMTSGIGSINLRDWLRSPKSVESMILLIGTIVMAYSNFKSFKEPSLLSKVTTIGGSLLAESKNILSMHQLMTGISDLAMNRKPPLRELSIAGTMILASHIASLYSCK